MMTPLFPIKPGTVDVMWINGNQKVNRNEKKASADEATISEKMTHAVQERTW